MNSHGVLKVAKDITFKSEKDKRGRNRKEKLNAKFSSSLFGLSNK